MRISRAIEIMRDAIEFHRFNQKQGHAMSGINYHVGAEDALRSTIDKIRDEAGEQLFAEANKPTTNEEG